jgi:tetratricopeptide (TPR) repeat protein
MVFDPNNHVVKLCIEGMNMEGKSKPEEATRLFFQGWNEASNDFERFIAAYHIARLQKNITEKLKWNETALQLALKINDENVSSAYPSLYSNVAKCYEELGDAENAAKNYKLSLSFSGNPADRGPFYHGTKADLQIGDLLTAGNRSNYQSEVIMNHIYFTALVNGAGLAAALAKGDGLERVYIVEPTGSFENDPNVTDKKFPGNPTRSYRSEAALLVTGEVTNWVRLTPEEQEKWNEKLANIKKAEIIN